MARTKTVKSTTKSTDIPVKKTDSFKGKAPKSVQSDTELSDNDELCWLKFIKDVSKLLGTRYPDGTISGQRLDRLGHAMIEENTHLVFYFHDVNPESWRLLCYACQDFFETLDDEHMGDWAGYLVKPANSYFFLYVHDGLLINEENADPDCGCDCDGCAKPLHPEPEDPEELALREEIKQVAKDLHEGRMVVDEGRVVVDLTKED